METTKQPSQILETLASQLVPQTTEQPSLGSNVNVKKRRDWLNKWLRLRITHHQLEIAENEIYKVCGTYSETPSYGITVVIHGENGCGKSHIAKKIAYWAERIALKIPMVNTESGVGLASVSFFNWPEVVDGFKRDQWTIVDDMIESTMLILDDIGAEHDPSRVGIEKLYVVLNRREYKWNIITTNVIPALWDEKFERRIASRLFRNAKHIDLSQVPDYSTT